MNNLGLKKLQVFCLSGVAALCALVGTVETSAQAPKQRLVTQAVDESNRVTLRGNVHPFARAAFDQGAIADTQPINRIYLLLNRSAEQQAALDKLMREQVDANSANFHKWLSPEDFGAQFGPSEDDVAAVKSWLSAHGFTGVKTNNGRTIVEFNGTVGTVRSAFATEIHKLNVRGEEHFANVSEPQIPAALANVVMGIPSLHNFRKQSHVKRFGKFRRDLLTGETRPLFTFTDVNGTFFGVGPADFAKIYNVPNGLNVKPAVADGTGQSIAIVARSNVNPQDVADFRSIFGLPSLTLVNSLSGCTGAVPQFCVILNGADPGLVSGDEGEADLDVEWSGAVAPGATIKFVVSESEQTDAVDGVDASAVFIVDNNVAPVMSESFGSCEAFQGASGNAFINSLWQQAAAEGITVSVSSGDNGSAACDDPNNATSATHGIGVSGTASTPFNISVGGTDFDDSGTQTTFWDAANTATTTPVPASAKGYIPEIPWNDSCATAGLSGCASATANTNLTLVAGSGGPSGCATGTPASQGVVGGTCAGYPKPAYQSGITPADGVRDTPDVSLFAADGLNKSFYIVCESDQDIPGDTGCSLTKFVTSSPFHDFQAVGGTSASAPSFAGIMALVNQKTGQRQGNANFVLYSLAKSEIFASCNSSSFTNPATGLPPACVFIDVTKSNNAVPCVGGSPNCSKTTSGGNGVLQSGANPAFTSATGYDLATGLGSINVTALLNSWAAPNPRATTVGVIASAPAISLNSQITFTGSVTPTTGTGTPTGEVIIENIATGSAVASGQVSGGSFSIETTMVPAGSPTNLRAHYGGDATFAPGNSSAIAVNVGKQSSQVQVSFVTFNGNMPVLSTAQQSVQYGSPYILRVDVAPNPNPNLSGPGCENLATAQVQFVCPTGTVSLLDGASPLNDFPNAQTVGATNIAHLNNRGFIEDQPIQLNAGTHNITATYAADANSSYTSQSASNTLALTITTATTTTAVAGSPSVIVSGGSVTLTATVSSASNSSQGPTGTIQFQNGTTNLGAAVTCTPKGATSSAGASCTAKLSTTLAAFPPVGIDNRLRWTPLGWLAALLAMMAASLLVMSRRMRSQQRGFAYAAIALFVIASAALAGCGGGSSGGGGGGSKTITITAKYSGDTNYASSTGSGSVTVQ
ncbi:MAG: hypothetical protein NVS9B14_12670 [Candidatus Acidiferrum sp.]